MAIKLSIFLSFLALVGCLSFEGYAASEDIKIELMQTDMNFVVVNIKNRTKKNVYLHPQLICGDDALSRDLFQVIENGTENRAKYIWLNSSPRQLSKDEMDILKPEQVRSCSVNIPSYYDVEEGKHYELIYELIIPAIEGQEGKSVFSTPIIFTLDPE